MSQCKKYPRNSGVQIRRKSIFICLGGEGEVREEGKGGRRGREGGKRGRREGRVSYPVQEEEGGEVWSVEGVKEIDELHTVDGIDSSESTPREDAELKELSDGTILEHFCKHKQNNHISLSPSLSPSFHSLG